MKPDFTTDGCTMWFDGWWRDCCVDHDLAYYTDTVTLQSHVDLGVCVIQTGGAGIIGLLMTAGTAAWWLVSKRRSRT